MNIIVDITYDQNGEVVGVHRFHLEPEGLISHPTIPGELVTPVQLIALFNANPDLRDKAGWHVTSKLLGDKQTQSRWDRLVAHSNGPEAHPELKALKLSAGDIKDETVLTETDFNRSAGDTNTPSGWGSGNIESATVSADSSNRSVS